MSQHQRPTENVAWSEELTYTSKLSSGMDVMEDGTAFVFRRSGDDLAVIAAPDAAIGVVLVGMVHR